jgi:hypothetical protein
MRKLLIAVLLTLTVLMSVSVLPPVPAVQACKGGDGC